MSNDLDRARNATAEPTAPARPAPIATSPAGRVPRTRTSTAWFGICIAALLFVVLIVFMLQNTASVEVSFLWMHGSLPLALALLVAAVGAALLTMVIGAARITQLRRLSRRQRQ
ncbi:lipopolysaccharide assembly protein LapA domain-containing protein [Micromonospora sp. CPCC 206061]|uniref:lipopolysaccharide assembly protein LapA domain-containing protein n=1 Tax=Micromonospora sp. CPCC 206061 TaxID=3122410 RepID=UPI002FF0473B